MKSFTDIYQEIYKDYGSYFKNGKIIDNIRNFSLSIVFIVLIFICYSTRNFYLMIPAGIILVILLLFVFIRHDEYKKKYKDLIIKRFIKEYSEDLEYFPESGITSSEYKMSGFENYFDRFSSEDLIEGKILDNCKIKMAEVHTEREETRTDSEGNTTTSYEDIFYGLFGYIKLNTSISISFKIKMNNIFRDWFKGKTKLQMDSGEFEKIYDVETLDKIGTLRILTSEVMDMLMDFKEKTKIIPELVFDNDILFIRFPVGNVFEPNLIKSDMDFEKLKRNYDMINFTFNLAKDFSKNILDFEE